MERSIAFRLHKVREKNFKKLGMSGVSFVVVFVVVVVAVVVFTKTDLWQNAVKGGLPSISMKKVLFKFSMFWYSFFMYCCLY